MFGLASLFFAVLMVCAIFLVAYFEPEKRIFHWLKGSWTSYYLVNGEMKSVPRRISAEERIDHFRGIPIIEIHRGPFKTIGVIRDFGESHLQILKVNNGTGDWVYLKDQFGLPLEEVLQVSNKHKSLQAMLDRIAELEQELKTANCVRQNYNAATHVLLSIIQTDRQFYRSKSSEHIRECLETIREFQKPQEPEPSSDRIWAWRNIFPPVVR